jgi:hypothetical protein
MHAWIASPWEAAAVPSSSDNCASSLHLRGMRMMMDSDAEDKSDSSQSTLQSCLDRVMRAEEQAMALCRSLLLRTTAAAMSAHNHVSLASCRWHNYTSTRNSIGMSFIQQQQIAGNSKTKVLESFPSWFRACANDIYSKRYHQQHDGSGSSSMLSFEAAFNRTANTTMPALHYIQLPHILANRREECKLVHVSRAEICMCSLSMMRVRFEVGCSRA